MGNLSARTRQLESLGILIHRFAFLGCMWSMAVSAFAQSIDKVNYSEAAYAFMDWFSCHDTIDFDSNYRISPVSNHLAIWDTELFLPADSGEEDPWALSGIGPLRAIPGIDSLFSEDDMAEMAREASNHAHARLQRNLACIKRGGKTRNKAVHWYYWPLFSKDRNMVLFRYGYRCGNTCGYGGTYVFRRVEGTEWRVTRSLGTWMS
jgi:hypothetical protein